MLGKWHVEAFTEETPGCVLSSENIFLRWPTLSCHGEGNTDVERHWRVRCQPHGVRGHTHGRKQSSRKLGDPGNIHVIGCGSVGEGEMPQCRHARFREVRQSRSTPEAVEQRWTANGSGVCGGKGTDQGKRQAVAIGPDSEPGCQVARIAERTRRITSCSRRLDHEVTKIVIIQGRSRMR
jgi:hypothetical protein